MKHRYHRIEAILKPLSPQMFRQFKHYLRNKVGLKFMRKIGVEGIASLLAASFKEQIVASMIDQSLHNIESKRSQPMNSSEVKELQTSTVRRCYHRIEAKLKPLSAKMFRRFKRYLRKNVGLRFMKNTGVEGIASLLADSFTEKKVVSMIDQSLRDIESKTSQPMISPKMECEEEELLPHMEMKDLQTSKTTQLSGPDTILGRSASENRVTNSNSSTARDGSNTFAPTASGCTVKGDLKLTMNISHHTNYYGPHKDQSQNRQMDRSCGLTNQALRPLPLYDQNKEKQNIQRIREQIKLCERNWIVQATSRLSMLNTELHVVTSEFTSITDEREAWQAEVTDLADTPETLTVDCNSMFKALPGEDKGIRCVLTKGIAGIGKTVAVQRVTLDWADGKANQNIDFIINLPFRKLNLITHEKHSLHGLLQVFYKEFGLIKDMDFYDKHSFLFILDGMDETKLPLEFEKNYSVSDVTETTTLDVLITSLLSGKLLPGALLWITSRPPAAKKLHRRNSAVDRVTEIRGFGDSQKADYLKINIKDPEMACRVIAGIKATRTLDLMCCLPVLCWMSSEVLPEILSEARSKRKPRPFPQTPAEMYARYIIHQTCTFLKRPRTGVQKYNSKMEHGDRETILKLGNLAYNILISENTLFTAQDMRDCKISKEEAARCHGLYTEPLDFGKEVYCFVHRSVQEFLAALYAFHEFANNRLDSVRAVVKVETGQRDSICLRDFLKGALDSAFDTKNGHLDLFVRFLFGVSHNSCGDLLPFLPEIPRSERDEQLKGSIFEDMLNRKDLSPEQCLNVIHCLSQLKDHSALTEFSSVGPWSPVQCTLLTYRHVMLEKPEVFDFRNSKTSEEGFRKLAPALRSSTTAMLSFCDITPPISSTVASILCTDKSRLTTLDLSHNRLGDAGVRSLCVGLLHQNCNMESLNLSHNSIGTRGVDALCDVLTSPTSRLLNLDLSSNDVADLGAASLAIAIGKPECKLQVLRLSGCRIKQSTFLTRILRSIPTLLRELDLYYNPLNDIGSYVLSELKRLGVSVSVDHSGEGRDKPGLQKYACDISLDLSKTKRYLFECEADREVFKIDQSNQVLSKEGLCQRHYLEMDCVQDVHIGMAYAHTPREGAGDRTTLGSSDHCWNLNFSREKCCAQHKTLLHTLSPPVMDSTGGFKIGVYLDWPAGVLSVYYVKGVTLTPLYAFHNKFTEPLHLVLRLDSPRAAISLSQVCLKVFP